GPHHAAGGHKPSAPSNTMLDVDISENLGCLNAPSSSFRRTRTIFLTKFGEHDSSTSLKKSHHCQTLTGNTTATFMTSLIQSTRGKDSKQSSAPVAVSNSRSTTTTDGHRTMNGGRQRSIDQGMRSLRLRAAGQKREWRICGFTRRVPLPVLRWVH